MIPIITKDQISNIKMEEFNARLRTGIMKTFNERKKIMPLTMEQEQELYYQIIRENIETAGEKWEKQIELEKKNLATKQKKFMEKIVIDRVKSIKISDGLCVPNFNYVNVEVEYYNSDNDEFPENKKMKNLKLSELDEVVDKIYEFPHYQTFHIDECSLKKYKIIHLVMIKKR